MEITTEAAAAAAAAPLNSRFVDGHGGHSSHIIQLHDQPSSSCNHIIDHQIEEDHNTKQKKKKVVNNVIKYKECLKNHAASIGANATDGCGEFMPSGEDGSLEALTCSACNCHRNFHRKEIHADYSPSFSFDYLPGRSSSSKALLIPDSSAAAAAAAFGFPSRSTHPHHPMIMSYNMAAMGAALQSSESEEHDHDHAPGNNNNNNFNNNNMIVRRAYLPSAHFPTPNQMVKKRFRTKFTAEQKEKMLRFAEKVGWKIQKQEESVVQQLCQEIGVKRRVLKVWMHNNKHNHHLPNNNNNTSSPGPTHHHIIT